MVYQRGAVRQQLAERGEFDVNHARRQALREVLAMAVNRRYGTGPGEILNTGTYGGIGVMDIVNRTRAATLGGQMYRMTVVCSDSASATRQSEVEFLVRFGL